MTETDLSQGPSANGAPGQDGQISGAAGERRWLHTDNRAAPLVPLPSRIPRVPASADAGSRRDGRAMASRPAQSGRSRLGDRVAEASEP